MEAEGGEMMKDAKMNKWEWIEFMQDSGYAVVKIEKPTVMQVSNKTEYITPNSPLSTLCTLLGFICSLGALLFLILYFNGGMG